MRAILAGSIVHDRRGCWAYAIGCCGRAPPATTSQPVVVHGAIVGGVVDVEVEERDPGLIRVLLAIEELLFDAGEYDSGTFVQPVASLSVTCWYSLSDSRS